MWGGGVREVVVVLCAFVCARVRARMCACVSEQTRAHSLLLGRWRPAHPTPADALRRRCQHTACAPPPQDQPRRAAATHPHAQDLPAGVALVGDALHNAAHLDAPLGRRVQRPRRLWRRRRRRGRGWPPRRRLHWGLMLRARPRNRRGRRRQGRQARARGGAAARRGRRHARGRRGPAVGHGRRRRSHQQWHLVPWRRLRWLMLRLLLRLQLLRRLLWLLLPRRRRRRGRGWRRPRPVLSLRLVLVQMGLGGRRDARRCTRARLLRREGDERTGRRRLRYRWTGPLSAGGGAAAGGASTPLRQLLLLRRQAWDHPRERGRAPLRRDGRPSRRRRARAAARRGLRRGRRRPRRRDARRRGPWGATAGCSGGGRGGRGAAQRPGASASKCAGEGRGPEARAPAADLPREGRRWCRARRLRELLRAQPRCGSPLSQAPWPHGRRRARGAAKSAAVQQQRVEEPRGARAALHAAAASSSTAHILQQLATQASTYNNTAEKQDAKFCDLA